MLSDGLRIWRSTIKQGAVWSTVVWSLVFLLLMILVLSAAGAGTLATSFYHPSLPGTTSLAAPAPSGALAGVGVMYLVLLAAGPFFIAGLYGLFGQAVAGEPITWRSFWSYALRFYGRAWGLYFFLFLWMMALSLIGGLLVVALHVVGGLLTAVAFILSLPWMIRMTGGLFVDRLSWGESFRRMFQGRHYGGLLGGLFLAAIIYVILFGLALVIMKGTAALGIILYFAIVLYLSVAGPLWGFALYRAASTS